MATEIQRYLIPCDGPDSSPIRLALGLVTELWKGSTEQRQAILLVPSKQHFTSTVMGRVLGNAHAKALVQGHDLWLGDLGLLSLESLKTFDPYRANDTILAVHASKRMLDLVDSSRSCHLVIVVPWTMDEVQDWIRTWNPITGEQQRPGDSVRLMDSLIVEEGLLKIHRCINLSTGLHHPLDKALAVETLRALWDAGEAFDAGSVRSWALRHGWDPDHASQLRDVAQAVIDGRRIHTDRPIHTEGVVEQLRAAAAEGTSKS